MRFDKLKYKALIKSKEQASVHQFSDSLNDALMSKDVTAFWNTCRSKFGINKPSPEVDGHCNQSNADYSASVFSSTSVPNSETRHAELFEKFKSRFAEYDHVDTCTNRINCELLDTNFLYCSAKESPWS